MECIMIMCYLNDRYLRESRYSVQMSVREIYLYPAVFFFFLWFWHMSLSDSCARWTSYTCVYTWPVYKRIIKNIIMVCFSVVIAEIGAPQLANLKLVSFFFRSNAVSGYIIMLNTHINIIYSSWIVLSQIIY